MISSNLRRNSPCLRHDHECSGQSAHSHHCFGYLQIPNQRWVGARRPFVSAFPASIPQTDLGVGTWGNAGKTHLARRRHMPTARLSSRIQPKIELEGSRRHSLHQFSKSKGSEADDPVGNGVGLEARPRVSVITVSLVCLSPP